MGLTVSLGASIRGVQAPADDLSVLRKEINIAPLLALVNGTGLGKADLVFTDTRPLAASASESLDLAGSLTDSFGATLTFVKVKGLYVRASAGNTNDVVMGGAASNAFATMFGDPTDKVVLKPGGFILLAADVGYTVAAGTGDLLKIANSGGTTGVNYDIAIIGASA